MQFFFFSFFSYNTIKFAFKSATQWHLVYSQGYEPSSLPVFRSNVFEVQPWYFISFYCCIVFPCVGISHFVYPLIIWHVGCLHFLAVRNKAAMNTCIRVSADMFSQVHNLRAELLSHMVTRLFLTAAAASHSHQQCVILIITILLVGVTGFHCGLICMSLTAKDVEHLFMCRYTIMPF